MSAYLFLLWFGLITLSAAERCAIHTSVSKAPMMELCDYEKGGSLVLTCRAVKKEDSTARCKDILENDQGRCDASITFEIFGQHEEIWKGESECATNSRRLRVDVKHSTVGHPLILPPININTLIISGGILRATGDTKELTVGLNSIRTTVDDFKVRRLKLNYTQADHLVLPKGGFQFANLDLFSLESMQFAGIETSGIDLENVKDFSMINLEFGGDRVKGGAIIWKFDNAQPGCTNGLATLLMDGIMQSYNFDNNSIAAKGACKNQKRSVVVKRSDFFPIIPKSIFVNLINDDEINELSFDPIECCQAGNSWVFESLSQQQESTRLNIQCSDLGGVVSRYSAPSRNEECKNRNVMPIYLIAIIAIGSLALILTIFGSICFFYVIPRHKAIHAKSQAESEMHSSADNHVIEMDSNQIKVVSVPKRSRSRSKKKGHKVKPAFKASPGVKNATGTTGPKRGVKATVLKVNSLSDDESPKKSVQSQMSATATIRTQATAIPAKEARSGVFQTIG